MFGILLLYHSRRPYNNDPCRDRAISTSVLKLWTSFSGQATSFGNDLGLLTGMILIAPRLSI